jgi:hypothetical protein
MTVGQTIILRGDSQRQFAHRLIDTAPADARVVITKAVEVRTKAQNRLLHRWFADVARAMVGMSEFDIKAECNLIYGRPILARDNLDWEETFGFVFDRFDRQAKIKAIRMLDIPFTRRMGVKQLSEYMDQMQRDYAEVGILLTDPEAQRYASLT